MYQKIIVFVLLATGVILLFVGCQNEDIEQKEVDNKEMELDETMLTLLTTVKPYGEVVHAVAIALENEVDATVLSTDSFKVVVETEEGRKERTITDIYTNNQANTINQPLPGEFLIIELDPDDNDAGTLVYNEEEDYNVRKELTYYLEQLEDVETELGQRIVSNKENLLITKEYQQLVTDFKYDVFNSDAGQNLDYYLFEPEIEDNDSYPLILFLHGNGERGNGNGINLLGNEGAIVWARPEQQALNPAYVLAPQAPLDGEEFFIWGDEPRNSSVKELVDATIEAYPIDRDRVYVVGISMGAIGTWRLLENYPGFFAAAVAIAGTTNYEEIGEDNIAPVDKTHLDAYFDVPIWAFHAEDDFVVTPDNIRELNELATEAGIEHFHYTEYKAETIMPMGHFSWVPALQDEEMLQWLFEQ